MKKDRPHFAIISLFLWYILVVACGPAPTPADSIARAAYYQDPALLERAWQLPVARTYPNPLEYQINGAFCGPAAAVNLLRSLGVGRHDQDNLFDKAEVSRWKARFMGLTLDELAGLIRSNADLEVAVLRDLSPEDFRAHLRRANDPAYRYLINFDRRPLFGVSIGHHSPLGGYLEDADLVFVLDVLHEYKPYLVPADRLYAAMDTPDSETGKKRGLLLVRGAASPAEAPQAVGEPAPPARVAP